MTILSLSLCSPESADSPVSTLNGCLSSLSWRQWQLVPPPPHAGCAHGCFTPDAGQTPIPCRTTHQSAATSSHATTPAVGVLIMVMMMLSSFPPSLVSQGGTSGAILAIIKATMTEGDGMRTVTMPPTSPMPPCSPMTCRPQTLSQASIPRSLQTMFTCS
ncbi:hypothetical protein AAFF_G00070080 [Aldrovandia affinis]|uniref:Uncharacterized protein n=1 Tax=Aldrovandia affinis TaxID=143900 RepID=A0AAD7WEB2_9TELE|nr:hypothetical protein AAFF_G00070080 [Aldrovandia affinis]